MFELIAKFTNDANQKQNRKKYRHCKYPNIKIDRISLLWIWVMLKPFMFNVLELRFHENVVCGSYNFVHVHST